MKWKHQPFCEVCGDEPATSFSYVNITKTGAPGKGRWVFAGACTTESERYYMEFKRIFKSPASTVDWLAHMHEKNWMDWNDFMDMMDRFRAATESFNQTN
jgi:hypothetical protein